MPEPASTARTPAPAPARDTRARPGPRPGATLAVTAAATAVALMNYTAPMLTLPDIAAAFGTPASARAWLLNGTPLGLAVLLLVAGSLADAHGRRRVFLLGTLALGLTTATGAFAGSTATFTAARIAQGAASAAVLAGSLGLLAQAYPAGRDRIRATGVWGASVSAGIALGPLLAGALSLVDWRLAYEVLGAAALVIAGAGARLLPADGAAQGASAGGADGATKGTTEQAAASGTRPDIAGAIALGLALAALLTALTLGRDGWLRPQVGLLLLASLALTALFVRVEHRSRTPMVDPVLLRRPAFLASTLGALFTGLAVIGLFSVVPALLQGGGGTGGGPDGGAGPGMSPLGAAWLFVLWSGTAFVVALQTRRLAGRLSAPYQLALGFVLSAAGVLALLGGLEGPAGSWPRLLPGLLVAGAGSGLLNAALPRLAVDSVPPERAAMGSGANNTARYIGSSAGVALMLALATAGPDTAVLVAAALALTGAGLTLALGRRQRR
ncbi:MFS family permease [Streptomyces sp. PvR006]|uniref:MFS transporter n=1 Tax=Streptomyces sp. PvR006 TaxID=2817860 RepID=UPI001AE3EAF0|nr:MFS transporter [Streptomyces sp. PvR006]MBP2582385.1 MFS family permease [Streptomyces sp. PvR006]